MTPPHSFARTVTQELLLKPFFVVAVLSFILAAGAIVGAPVARAHDAVIGSTPADRAVLEEFPRAIELEFSGDPKPGFNTVAVSDEDAQKVLYSSQEPRVEGNIVTLELPDNFNPGPGNYIVGFQITSSDGHPTKGKTSFSVATADNSDVAMPDTQHNSETAVADQGKFPVWLLGVGGILVALILAAVLLINRKAR